MFGFKYTVNWTKCKVRSKWGSSYYFIKANLFTCYYIDWRLNHLSIVLEVEIVVIRELRCLWLETDTTRLVLLKILSTCKTVEAPAIQCPVNIIIWCLEAAVIKWILHNVWELRKWIIYDRMHKHTNSTVGTILITSHSNVWCSGCSSCVEERQEI